MRNIIRKVGELEVIQKIGNGYVNATQLCKAYEIQTGTKKSPSHWFETNRANRFIELVSSETGIPVSQLFISNKGNTGRHDQGTWIHPDLATPFASWLSAEYEWMVSRWVQDWIKTGENPIKQPVSSRTEKSTSSPQEPTRQEPTLQEISALFGGLKHLGIEDKLVESAKLTAVARSIPRLTIAAEEGKRLISSQMTVDEVPMSPTELGQVIAKRLGWNEPLSAQKINQALRNAGLQTCQSSIDDKGKTINTWVLTERGKQYGQIQMNTARTHNKTVFCIRWFSSVLPIIERDFFPKSA